MPFEASGALTVPLPGAVGTWAAAAVAPLSIKEPAVDAAYARYTDAFREEMWQKYGTSKISTRDLLLPRLLSGQTTLSDTAA